MRQILRFCGARLKAVPVLAALTIALNLAAGCLFNSAQAGGITFYAASGSMMPTLEPGDSFATSGLGGIETMRRGDVVIYRGNAGDSVFYLGRIVGMPGETFPMVGGVPHIDGRPFAQREKEWISVENAGETASMRVLEETTPEGKSYRIGTIATRMFLDDTEPVAIPAGHVVILGDTRQNSADSRLKEVGPISAAAVIRKVGLIFWANSWSRIGSLVQ